MDKLIKGVRAFRNDISEDQLKRFAELASGQNPHTLFVACSDSRVMPELMTQAEPGDLFKVRNVANMVPHYDKSAGHVEVVATLEYGVMALGVENIVICGHSGCGGCAALYAEPGAHEAMPGLKSWLMLNQDLPRQVLAMAESADPERRSRLTEELNVRRQITNVHSYPFVRERVRAGKLTVQGWYFEIPTGRVFILNETTDIFEPVQ